MWLSNLRLVLPDRVVERGALRIEDGLIQEIRENVTVPGALDLSGMTCMPGIVDLHGDMLERDIEPRPGARFPVTLALYELDKRLAATGITTAYAAVSFAWSENDMRSQEKAQEIIYCINAQRDHLLVDFLIHARFEITNPDTAPILKPMLEQKLIHLVSVMDHTPGQGQYKNIPKYVDFMTRWLGTDPEIVGEDVIERLKQSIAASSSKPRNWDIVRDVTVTALEHGIPVASHDDDTVEKVRRLAEMGVTISEFPVTMEAAEEAKQLGMHIIMGAPNAYRGSSNTGNLSARDTVKAGVVDILATDYFPAAPFQSAILLANQENIPLHEAVKLVSQNPADAMGLTDRGRIAVGYRADLVLYEGVEYPRVHGTLRQGIPIYWDGKMARLAHQQHVEIAPAEIPDEASLESV